MMWKQLLLKEPEDYFRPVGNRMEKGVYFCKISGYNQRIHTFLCAYYEAAGSKGRILQTRLQNPDREQLSYYQNQMGNEFQLTEGFISRSLNRWIPGAAAGSCRVLAEAMDCVLVQWKASGKNNSILKNTYLKFMCWLYYQFGGILNQLGSNSPPKILCEGEIGIYELLFLTVLSKSGADIVWLQGTDRETDLKNGLPIAAVQCLQLPDMEAFPPGFCLKQIQEEVQNKRKKEQPRMEQTDLTGCINTWMSGDFDADIRKKTEERGNRPDCLYHCFCRITGVFDRITFGQDLYCLLQDLRASGRRVFAAAAPIPIPTTEEIGKIRRKNSQTCGQLARDLAENLPDTGNLTLRQIMRTAWMNTMLEEERAGCSRNRLNGKAVYLLCWLKRYQKELFGGWKPPEISCFFYLGGCRTDSEALFCRFLAKMPVDVVILNPDKDKACCLHDERLCEISRPESLPSFDGWKEILKSGVGTAAYHAEKELDQILYHDTGMYRNQQFRKAETVTLHTMYEEISILWKQEIRYRPGFGTAGDTVSLPVLFSKISGIKDGDVPSYWRLLRGLITPDTAVIRSVPHTTASSENPVKPYASEFYRNGRLLKEKIKAHRVYSYGFLRESVQEYILDRLEVLLRTNPIVGMGENGMEYTTISTVLNLERPILRMLQSFDFTKRNPKLIYLLTEETVLSPEDTIYAEFLHLAGFDVLFFVPTGYRSVEKWFRTGQPEEHQIGTYRYDLQVPELDGTSEPERLNWKDRIRACLKNHSVNLDIKDSGST